MSILSDLKPYDMDAGVDFFKTHPGTVLLDVRMADEYAERHIGGSINLSLKQLDDIYDIVPDFDTPILTYCETGGRSALAAANLCEMGYTQVVNIGGIESYHGATE